MSIVSAASLALSAAAGVPVFKSFIAVAFPASFSPFSKSMKNVTIRPNTNQINNVRNACAKERDTKRIREACIRRSTRDKEGEKECKIRKDEP